MGTKLTDVEGLNCPGVSVLKIGEEVLLYHPFIRLKNSTENSGAWARAGRILTGDLSHL